MIPVDLCHSGMLADQRQFADRLERKRLQGFASHIRNDIPGDQSALPCRVLGGRRVGSRRSGLRHFGAVAQRPNAGAFRNGTMLIDHDAAVTSTLAVQAFYNWAWLDASGPDQSAGRNLSAGFELHVITACFRNPGSQDYLDAAFL